VARPSLLAVLARLRPLDEDFPTIELGANDMLIAAKARVIHAVCVTANVAEFKRVPGLTVENWLA